MTISRAKAMSSEELSEASDRSMSPTEDLTLEDTEETEEASGEEEEGIAVAQPPRDSAHASKHVVALTGSSALDILDQLLASNKIGKERASRLRRKYNHTREALESSRAQENTLLVNAKELRQHLSQQQRVLEKASTFPEGDNSEASQLRQVLLQYQNDLDQSRERAEKLDRELTQLSEERDEVEREWSRLPKKEELEQHLRELTRQTEELRDEVTQRLQDVKRYQDELDIKNYRIADILQETEELQEVEEKLQDELTEIRKAPLNFPRELDTLHKRKAEVQVQIKDQKTFLQELTLQIDEVREHMKILQKERVGAEVQLREEKDSMVTHELHLERLAKDLSTAKEREATLLEDSATMELHLRHRSGEHRLVFEALSARTKDKDRELKLLKKAELQLSTLRQSLEQLKQKADGLAEKVAANTQELEEGRCRREELLTEVQQLSRSKVVQDGLTSKESLVLENKQVEEQKLRAQAKAQQDRAHHLSKDIITMTKARDRDSRDYYKAKYQQQVIADNLKTREGETEEQRKRIRELEGRLQDFAQAYEVVKTERNKTHSQIQFMHKLAAELQEKTKILQNEIDILRASADSKEKLLQKCSLVQSSKVQERDTQRQELEQVRVSQEELSSSLETQREELHKLTQQATTAEQNLSRLRRHYEQAVQERNDLGLQLIERNEEVCVFYEKQHMQEAVVRKANMELESRQEETRFLKMELSRLQNDLLVGRKALLGKEKLETELVTAQIELKEGNTHLSSLERAVECASDPARLRLLPGNNPSLDDLRQKTEALEAQLAEREQQLLEKELLYEQVCRLTEKTGKRAESQRGVTLQVAGRVGHYQGRIRDTMRKMMALVSELSMQQASALRLQQEVQEAEAQLEQAYRRVEAGEAPNQEAASHWERELRLNKRRQWESQARKQLAEVEEAYQLPGGMVTSAEPRPNAYMPLGDEDLPIPKPYGSHAPFKPTQPGANIRHIRKPQPQPIDI